MTTTGPELLLLAGLAPARMAASLAAPAPDEPNSGIRVLPGVFGDKQRIRCGCRTRPSACDTLSRFCARHVLCWFAFLPVPALRSTGSATGRPALFAGFVATMAGSDF